MSQVILELTSQYTGLELCVPPEESVCDQRHVIDTSVEDHVSQKEQCKKLPTWLALFALGTHGVSVAGPLSS